MSTSSSNKPKCPLTTDPDDDQLDFEDSYGEQYQGRPPDLYQGFYPNDYSGIQSCRHEPVDVGFRFTKIVCKLCNVELPTSEDRNENWNNKGEK